MAQIVKLEPGDILVLPHVGSEAVDSTKFGRLVSALKEQLNLRAVYCFEGAPRASKTVFRGRVTKEEANEIWHLIDEVVSGDGGE